MKLKIKNSFKFSKKFIYWLVPLIFLGLACLLLFLLFNNKQSSAPLVKELLPEKVIDINEPFSGKIYFNNEFGKTEFSNLIVSSLDNAKKSVEIAVYSMNHKMIRDAIYRAANRGVNVKIILSLKQKPIHDQLFTNLPKNIERLDVELANNRGLGAGLMHDKFIVIDRGQASQNLLFGAYNFTELQEKYDPSFILQTSRPEIVNIFGEEFDRIYANARSEKGFNKKSSPFAALIKYPQGYLEIWFSPESYSSPAFRQRLVSLIENSSRSLEVMIWNLTDKKVARILANQASGNKTVKILTDDVNFFNKDSAFFDLMQDKEIRTFKNLEILTDAKRNGEIRDTFKQNFNSFLHHHLLLVDGQTALFGTNNWSTAGFYRNYESAMVTNIPEIYKAFQETFDINYNKAK